MEENTSKAYVGSAAALLDEQFALATGTGSDLFVINLCASMAPVPLAGKTLPGLENYRLYQVSRVEDGRTRYRLRLGFFTSEAHAEAVLGMVREKYPTAFAACLADEDRKFTRGFAPASTSDTQRQKRPVSLVVDTPRPAAAAQAAPAAKQVPATAKPAPSVAKTSDPKSVTVQTRAPVAAKAAQTMPAAPKASEPKATAPAAKAPTSTIAVHAPKTSADHGIELTSEDEASRAVSPAAAATPVEEIEMSWEPPALQPTAPASRANGKAAAPQVLAPGFKTEPVIKAPPAAKPAAAKTAPVPAPIKSKPAVAVELTLAAEPVAASRSDAAPSAPAAPFHVGKGVEIPEMSLTLAAESHAPAARPAKPAPTGAMSAARPAPAMRLPGLPHAPELDSTQTIRALTSAELNDDSQEKWFAIQLAISEQPVNLDAMPHLDIFEAYRLYSVANAGSGKIVHSLRLGFFREATSAEAVAGYLNTFFQKPSVLRISTSEQARFKDPPAPKPVNEAKVVDLSDARQRAAKPPVIPTVTMEVPMRGVEDRSPTGSHKLHATGSHKLNSTGSHKINSSGPHKLSATGTHRALGAAAKTSGVASKSAPAKKGKSHMATGKFRAMGKKSLNEQLLDEAREVELSASGIRKLPKNDSLLSRLVDKLKK